MTSPSVGRGVELLLVIGLVMVLLPVMTMAVSEFVACEWMRDGATEVANCVMSVV